MSSILIRLPKLFESYKNWVSRNPQFVSDCETTAKWFSYIIAGKINDSHILTELVYCMSNLIVLMNDRIIFNARQIELPSSGDTLKLWLTILEYCEVFLELSAKRLWGNTGKWLLIASIQIFKCFSRLVLVYGHKESIVQDPPIPVLMRSQLEASANGNTRSNSDMVQMQMDQLSFTLKSSGRIVRKVDGSPPLSVRSWKPLQKRIDCDNEQMIEQPLAGRQLIAETIYILKPLTHLGLVLCCGTNSWKPWITSLVMDLTSLHLHRSGTKAKIHALTPKQRLQLSKRITCLILYLLRSPFYEKHSKDKINALLMSFSKNIPLANVICNPLTTYLPFWQSNYFYMWST